MPKQNIDIKQIKKQFQSYPLFGRALDLTCDLIKEKSITPDQSQALDQIATRLAELGFKNEWLNFGEVRNLYSVYENGDPVLMFAGHTDVVPTGNLDLWQCPPFAAELTKDKLIGRGAADMKSGIAAFLIACEELIAKHEFKGSIAFLITADEEGVAIDGTRKVVDELVKRGAQIDFCIVGEPSSQTKTGDTLKNGRRGSLSAKLKVLGKQGHIAYPQNADNPIHKIPALLSRLLAIRWDEGNDFFQPTSLQFSNIHAGTGADNVIPNDCILDFNFRYNPESTKEGLKKQVIQVLDDLQLKYEISWRESGNPFFSKPNQLATALASAIEKTQGINPQFTTGGGTSDGRFIIALNCEIVECGLTNATIHQINESITYQELADLTQVYYEALIHLFSAQAKSNQG